jgi:hypothetical protein
LLLVTPVSKILVSREELGRGFDRYEGFRIDKTMSRRWSLFCVEFVTAISIRKVLFNNVYQVFTGLR